MFKPRIIPVLLLKDKYLVKSKCFKDFRYIGDPINAMRIFNDLKADELVFLDIVASKENRLISLDFVREVGEEANMPFSVGGGIRTIKDIKEIINAGAERVIIGSYAVGNPDFIREAADCFGSSTVAVCVDVKKKMFGKEQVWTFNGTKASGIDPVLFAQMMEKYGAGEIIIQSIERDGCMDGYDIELIKRVSNAVTIPVVALGGAGNLDDLKQAFHKGNASGVAAGSLFVYHGSNHGVLINYPEKSELHF